MIGPNVPSTEDHGNDGENRQNTPRSVNKISPALSLRFGAAAGRAFATRGSSCRGVASNDEQHATERESESDHNNGLAVTPRHSALAKPTDRCSLLAWVGPVPMSTVGPVRLDRTIGANHHLTEMEGEDARAADGPDDGVRTSPRRPPTARRSRQCRRRASLGAVTLMPHDCEAQRMSYTGGVGAPRLVHVRPGSGVR